MTKKAADKPVRVSGLRISNILGIEEMEIRPGAVTVVEGQNGKGKTSTLEAIKAVLSGGHDATLLRHGAESGEIVMVLSDGVEITKTVTAEKTDVKVQHPNFGKMPRTRTYIERLLDSFALSPVEFLLAKPDKRVDLLLGAIPMKVDEAEIADALELCTDVEIDTGRHALQVLAAIEKTLFDQRTGLNRAAKEKRSTATEMKRAIPIGTSEDCDQALAAARAAYTRQQADYHGAREAAVGDIDRDKSQAMAAATTAIERAEAEWRTEVAELNARFKARIDDLKESRAKDDAAYDQERSKKLETIDGIHAGRGELLQKAVADAEAAMKGAAGADQARKVVFDMEARAGRLEEDSQVRTDLIEDLARVKTKLLADMPIPGLEVRDGDIYLGGVPFDRVNESERVRLAFRVAAIRTGNLPLICIDGAERLDSNSLAAMEEVAADMGLQLVLARVTDGPLAIRVSQ